MADENHTNYVRFYLRTIDRDFLTYDDCRKALILHRLYLSLENLFKNKLMDNGVRLPDPSQHSHSRLVRAFCDYLNLTQNTTHTLDQLRRFRSLFANNYTLLYFNETLLSDICRQIKNTMPELIALAKGD